MILFEVYDHSIMAEQEEKSRRTEDGVGLALNK